MPHIVKGNGFVMIAMHCTAPEDGGNGLSAVKKYYTKSTGFWINKVCEQCTVTKCGGLKYKCVASDSIAMCEIFYQALLQTKKRHCNRYTK